MIAASALLPFALASLASTAPARYDGHALVRVWLDDAAALASLRARVDEVWTEHPGRGFVDVRVRPHQLAALRRSGIPFELRVADLQAGIDAERTRLAAAPHPTASTWFDDFRDYDAIMDQLDAMAAAAPHRVSVVDVGVSLQARPIRALRISDAPPGAPAVLYSGTMHAREWLATMATMCVADRFATADDAVVAELLSAIEIWVVPVINPDGYVISWTEDRYWRKNARDGYGVDLNRNWDYQWAVVGASDDPWAEDYHGPAPFSEPESSALRDFIVARPQLRAHIDFHSFSQLVLRPWGYDYSLPPDEATLSTLGQQMSDAMWDATGTDYASIHAAELYPAAGAVDDWGYGVQGLMAFTIELRGDDFVVPPSQIGPACDENVAAALQLAAWVRQMAPQPPDHGGTTGDGSPPGDAGSSSGDAGAEGDGGAPGSSDGGDDPSPGDAAPEGAALPPGFGLGSEAAGGCRLGDTAPLPWWLVLAPWLVRRRPARQGT
ncbi:MAG: M14 family metallopeptidase [Nannocystaceae bacterium]